MPGDELIRRYGHLLTSIGARLFLGLEEGESSEAYTALKIFDSGERRVVMLERDLAAYYVTPPPGIGCDYVIAVMDTRYQKGRNYTTPQRDKADKIFDVATVNIELNDLDMDVVEISKILN